MTRQSAIYSGTNIYQETATCRYDKGIGFKKGDQVYLGDGDLVPWDVNMPKYHSWGQFARNGGDQSHEWGFLNANFNNGSGLGALQTRYSKRLPSGGHFVVAYNKNTSAYGLTGLRATVYEIDTDRYSNYFLDVTYTSLIVYNGTLATGNIDVVYMGDDATYEYFALSYYVSPNVIVVLLRIHKTTKVITKTTDRSTSGTFDTRLVHVDTYNDKLIYNDGAAIYSYTYDLTAFTQVGTRTTLSVTTDFKNRGWPSTAFVDTDHYMYDNENDVIYFFKYIQYYKLGGVSSERMYNIYRIEWDGTDYTFKIIAIEKLLTNSPGASYNYYGSGHWIQDTNLNLAGGCGVFHIETSAPFTVTDYTKELGLLSGDNQDVNDLIHCTQWPTPLVGVINPYPYPHIYTSDYVSHFGVWGTRLFQNGLCFDGGVSRPGLDYIRIHSFCSNDGYGVNQTVISYYNTNLILVDEDADFLYGIKMRAQASGTTVYQKSGFRLRKSVDQMSKGPIGRALTDSTRFQPASAKFTITGQVSDGDTVTIGGKTYTFQTTLTDVDGNVDIGSTAINSLNNLRDAINLWPTVGTDYATSMTVHAQVHVHELSGFNPLAVSSGARLEIFATKVTDAATADAITVSEVCTVGSWDGATMSGTVEGGKFTLERYDGNTLVGSVDTTQSYGEDYYTSVELKHLWDTSWFVGTTYEINLEYSPGISASGPDDNRYYEFDGPLMDVKEYLQISNVTYEMTKAWQYVSPRGRGILAARSITVANKHGFLATIGKV